jgi:LacI family transcriptional regulator
MNEPAPELSWCDSAILFVMPTTMKDIGRDLGVSVVTVSKVWRSRSDISVQNRKRVLQRMTEVNHQQSPAARNLVAGRRKLIGLIVPDRVHLFFVQVAKGISAKLRSQEYSQPALSSLLRVRGR